MDWVTFWTWAVQFVIACALLLIVCVVAFAAVVGIRERNDEKGEANPAVVLLIAGIVTGAVLASVSFWFVGSLPAHAAASVCAGHVANQPYLSVVNPDGSSTLAGSGGVYGCQSGSSVTVTVTAQHWNNTQAAWVDQATRTSFHWFNPRYSKSYYLTVYFGCKVGWSRTVMSGDGFVVEAQPVRFTRPDGEPCGAYGGGTKTAPSDPFCVALSEARSVFAGERVSSMLTRIAPEARPRFHTRHIRDVDGCGRNTVYRFRFEQASSGRAVVAWKWLSCRLHSECVVVVHYPEPRS